MNLLSSITKIALIICLLYCNISLAQDTASAKKDSIWKPKYYLIVGAFRPEVSTTLQINGERGPGAILSLEENLGFSDRSWLFRVEGSANFTKRSGINLTYVSLNRKQDWTADQEVTIFDTTFTAGAKLGIYFNTMFIAASYKYTIFSRQTWDAGLSVGIRYLQIKTGVDFQSNNLNDYKQSVTVPAPVPVLGLFGTAYMTDHLRFRYNLDYFTIAVSGVKGAVVDNRFGLEYYVIKNLGVGAALNILSYSVEEVPLAEDFSGKIKYSLNGFSFYLTARF